MNGQKYTLARDPHDHRDNLYSHASSTPLPKRVDLSPGCSPVENQGQLGSCTGNGLVGVMEFLEKKSGAKVVDLSRLFVYFNERNMEGTVNQDAGANIRDGVKTLAKFGVCAEALWPYDVAKFKQKPSDSCYVEAKTRTISQYSRITSLDGMKHCLAEGYPIVMGFTVFESFESEAVAKTGVVAMPLPGEKCLGGHCVVAVGYDEDAQTILCRNSWGESWGQKGYFTLPYGYITNPKLSSDFWTIRK